MGIDPNYSFSSKLPSSLGLTFDDVLLRPMKSNVEPGTASLKTRISKNIELNIPVLSAAMDTVTESIMAVSMAQFGGLGVIHRNMTIEEMVFQIQCVKRAEELIIRREDVFTAHPNSSVKETDEAMMKFGVSGAPVVDESDRVLGIISGTDIRPFLRFGEDDNVRSAMTKKVITASKDITSRDALNLMYENKIERVPIVDSKDHLVGLVTMQGILQSREYESASRDKKGLLQVGVAIGPFDEPRALAAQDAGADILFIDCAHAHNESVIESAHNITKKVNIDVVVGNIGTRDAAEDLSTFADGLKVGIGPGSICTTRVVTGVGVPQLTAISDVADIASIHDIPIIADGGIRYSGDATKAIASGADAVMLGSYIAGTDESPGRLVTLNGKRYKQYRGMGSIGAMKSGSSDRYLKGNPTKDSEYVPEGIEAATPYKGSLETELTQLIGGIHAGLGYVGAANLSEFKKRAQFIQISYAGYREGHPHDVVITDEAPNYSSVPFTN